MKTATIDVTIALMDYEVEYEYEEYSKREIGEEPRVEITDIYRNGVSIAGLIEFLEGVGDDYVDLWGRIEKEAMKHIKEQGA